EVGGEPETDQACRAEGRGRPVGTSETVLLTRPPGYVGRGERLPTTRVVVLRAHPPLAALHDGFNPRSPWPPSPARTSRPPRGTSVPRAAARGRRASPGRPARAPTPGRTGPTPY